MRKIAALLLLVVFVPVNYGLAQAPPPSAAGAKSPSFYTQEARKIKIGQTTESEVLAILGQPSARGGLRTLQGGQVTVEPLFYGPLGSGQGYAVAVYINKSTGKVWNIHLRP